LDAASQRAAPMNNKTMNLINRLFHLEEMDGDGECEIYLRRWTLFSFSLTKKSPSLLSVYLHHFVGDDWARDLHDHPKRFWSFGLWGRYIEETPSKSGYGTTSKMYFAPWFRTFPPKHIHRVRLVDGVPCWTLVVVGWPKRDWGFWHKGVWVPWEYYVNEMGHENRSCD